MDSHFLQIRFGIDCIEVSSLWIRFRERADVDETAREVLKNVISEAFCFAM